MCIAKCARQKRITSRITRSAASSISFSYVMPSDRETLAVLVGGVQFHKKYGFARENEVGRAAVQMFGT